MKFSRTAHSNQTGKTSLRKVLMAAARCAHQPISWLGLSLLDKDLRQEAALWIDSERVSPVLKCFGEHDISCEEAMGATELHR